MGQAWTTFFAVGSSRSVAGGRLFQFSKFFPGVVGHVSLSLSFFPDRKLVLVGSALRTAGRKEGEKFAHFTLLAPDDCLKDLLRLSETILEEFRENLPDRSQTRRLGSRTLVSRQRSVCSNLRGPSHRKSWRRAREQTPPPSAADHEPFSWRCTTYLL